MGWGDIAQGAALGVSTGTGPVGIGVGALLGLLQGNAKDKKNKLVNEARAVEMANSPYTGRPITEAVNEPSDFAKTAEAIASGAGAVQAQDKAVQDNLFKERELSAYEKKLANDEMLMRMSAPKQGTPMGNNGWGVLLNSLSSKE